MKILYLVRHAKSSWSNLELSDFERPLNDRGKKDAPAMAKRMKEREIHIDHMITSPAKRALTTCQEFCKVLKLAEIYYTTEKKLYHADTDTLFESVRYLNDNFQSVMLFGHNPGITEFANLLFKANIENMPTASVVAGTLAIHSWEEIKSGCGTLEFFDFPRSLSEE